MIELVPIEKITSPYGEERFKELDSAWIGHLIMENDSYAPLIVDKDYRIIDGHHRLSMLRVSNKKEVRCIRLNCSFEETEPLRDFQKHLKGMVPQDWNPLQLKREFEYLLPWIILQSTK